MLVRFSYIPLLITIAAQSLAQQPAAKLDTPQTPAAVPSAPAVQQATVGTPEGEAVRPKLISQRERTARLQIFLDQKLFSPGMIDGKPGKFLVEALMRWQ